MRPLSKRMRCHRAALFCALTLSLGLASLRDAHAEPEGERGLMDAGLISAHGVAGRVVLKAVPLIADDSLDLDGEISDELRAAIFRQSQYLVGNIHGIEGGLSLHSATLSRVSRGERLADGLARYHYDLEADAVITQSAAPPAGERASFPVVLPERVDEESLRAFFDKYSADCVPNPYKSYRREGYWYYFRPEAYDCPLREAASMVESGAVYTTLSFEAAPAREDEPKPEYARFWEDGRLVVTAVYALVGGLLGEQGLESYEQVFDGLRRSYGEPVSINDEAFLGAQRFDLDRPVIEATFETPRGPLEVHLFLINTLDAPSHEEGDALASFFEDYDALSQRSDLLIYNGHARYGADNAKLDALGSFSGGRHQLFYVNTCASYTYGLPQVREQLLALNAEAEAPEHALDLILNGMPAMGHEIATMNLRVIDALVVAEESYRSILSDLYAKQQLLVLRGADRREVGAGEAGKVDLVTGQRPVAPSAYDGAGPVGISDDDSAGCSATGRGHHLPLTLLFCIALLAFPRRRQDQQG